MSIGTAASPARVTLDTNIIISGLGFGGKPREILDLILDDKIKAVTSPILLAELEDVITKKFQKLTYSIEPIKKQIRKKFRIVKPEITLLVVKDEPDNRVLEAATEGDCKYIVTGDKELLKLGVYQDIKIVTADQFLKILEEN